MLPHSANHADHRAERFFYLILHGLGVLEVSGGERPSFKIHAFPQRCVTAEYSNGAVCGNCFSVMGFDGQTLLVAAEGQLGGCPTQQL